MRTEYRKDGFTEHQLVQTFHKSFVIFDAVRLSGVFVSQVAESDPRSNGSRRRLEPGLLFGNLEGLGTWLPWDSGVTSAGTFSSCLYVV